MKNALQGPKDVRDLVTPAPAAHPGHTGSQDNVIVTRWFADAVQIQDVKTRLGNMGDPAPAIENPKHNDAQPGEVGTFDVWT